MRPIIILISILAIVIGGGIWSFAYIKDTSNDLLDIATDIEDKIYKDNWKEAEEKLYDFEKMWNTYKPMWTVLLDHNMAYNIEIYVAKVSSYLGTQSSADALSEIESIKRSLIHVIERNEFNLSNIL